MPIGVLVSRVWRWCRVADDKLAIPSLPTPGRMYDQLNEAAFRREVAQIMYQVDAALARFADTVSSGLITHATSHAPGGSDTLDSYYSEVDHTHDLNSDLDDVTITGPVSGDLLQWNGSAWVDRTAAEAGLSETGHTHEAADITDFSTAADARIAAAALEDIGDVDAYSSIGSGEILEWDGDSWLHQTKAEAGISEVGHGHVFSDVTNLPEYMEFFNGTFLESFQTTLSESGGVVTMSLEQSGGGDLTARFSSGNVTIDCTPAATIDLTVGTDAAPQTNYIYVLESTGAVTKSTSGWPSAEHVKIAFFNVPSAAFVAANGAYVHQNWNDHAAGTDGMGHMSHMAERSRRDGAYWFSGLEGTGTDDYLTITSGNVEFQMATGVAYQMHKHTFPAFDTSAGDVVLVKNWSGDPYHDITNLYDITADSTGTTISNNRWFTLVVWAVANNTGTYHPTIINLPSGNYQTQAQAEADLNSTADYSVPREFDLDSSTAVLVCRLIVQKQASTWAYGSTVDLRGLNDAIAAGGGGGGGGSQATEFSDAAFRVFDDVDNTKVLALQVSGVTTATTRTLTIPDSDGTITLDGHTHVEADITDLGTYEDYLGLPASDGYILSSTAAGVRSWIENTATVSSLNDVGDVTITGPASNDLLQWNGSAWVDRSYAEAGVAEASHTHPVADITDFDPADYLPLTAGSGAELSGSLYMELASGSAFIYMNASTTASAGISFRDSADDDRFALFYREGVTYDIVLEAFGAPTDNVSNGDLFRFDTETLAGVFGGDIDVTGDLDVSGGNITIYTGHEIDGSSASYLDIESLESIRFLIDSNANSTAASFSWWTDAYSNALMTLYDEGQLLLGAGYQTGVYLDVRSEDDTKLILRDGTASSANEMSFYYQSTEEATVGMISGAIRDFQIENLVSNGDILFKVTSGGQIKINDGGASTTRVASIANLTTSTTAPSATTYPYGAIWGIY